MTTTHIESLATNQRQEKAGSAWKPLYRVGGVAALTIVGIMIVQIIVFIAWPPPSTVLGYFTLFHRNGLLGLLSLDLLYNVDNVLLVLLYLALYASLRRASPTFMAIALALGLVGIAAYFASNPAFGMFSLSSQYAVATTAVHRLQLEAAGQAIMANYAGTAYVVSYILSGVALLIIAVVMLRSTIFAKGTAVVGLVMGIMMLVPASAGTVGLIFAFGSLIPFAIWLILVARRLLQLGQVES